MTGENVLRFAGVSRTEGGAAAPLLADISFEVKAGSLFALVGADGAGKTTLMRIAAGLLKPSSGRVEILGEDLYRNLNRLQGFLGYMPQKFGLYTDLSVQENLTLYADLFGLDEPTRRERFRSLLAMTGLASFTERLAGKLSGGMKQKLGLACALLNHPKILLLDEPSVGVDPLSRRELWEILRQNVRTEGMTVIVATTYMDEAALCDEVAVIDSGRLAVRDTPARLAGKARGLTFAVKPREGEKVRDLQAMLLDDTEQVLDAVPEAGFVRVLLRKFEIRQEVERRLHRTLAPVAARLEDGVIVQSASSGGGHYLTMGLKVKDNPSKRPIVAARDLVRRFGDFTAVDRTSFEVYPGEIFGLLGPNGAGKTTTFKMLCGLLAVTSGELEVAGVNVKASREAAREHLGYMSQKFALYGDLSVEQNLRFFGQAYGLFGRVLTERVARLAQEFGLSDDLKRPAKSLPGGIKQRLAMAAALLHSPDILFLDEPTSGADVAARRQFWRWMTALSQAGTTIIVTTHFMEEAQYCDRLLIQDGGKPLIVGTPEAVRAGAATMDEAFIRIVTAFRKEGGA